MTIRNLLAYVVLTTFVLHQINACITPKYTIEVLDSLPTGSPLLEVTCKSGDTDLGNHVLDRGQSFSWSFCVNIIRTTLYFCNMHWGTKQKSFDVFNAKKSGDCAGGLCVWVAFKDGIYVRTDERRSLEKIYDWQ
ncbi:hypothetical protein PHJA_001597600 [Phtheirospermum japonicum]|uniref:S-protein homolog n=1 Tax=Phtheirospermum japonicum TaxID=374723 RepID=A0A830C8L5_9LAMI|nr:hypothetical protein PHJA_001597600 [Phtheirospermum japonicum]